MSKKEMRVEEVVQNRMDEIQKLDDIKAFLDARDQEFLDEAPELIKASRDPNAPYQFPDFSGDLGLDESAGAGPVPRPLRSETPSSKADTLASSRAVMIGREYPEEIEEGQKLQNQVDYRETINQMMNMEGGGEVEANDPPENEAKTSETKGKRKMKLLNRGKN